MTATVPTTAQPATPGEALARLFHETYEQLAPEHGYRTREASAKPWEDVPEQNRALMVAMCEVVLRRWADELDAAPATTGCACTRAAEAIRTRLAEAWPHLNEDPVFLDQVAHHAAAAVCIAGLSTVPPAGTAAQ